jgi:hypothetical protein
MLCHPRPPATVIRFVVVAAIIAGLVTATSAQKPAEESYRSGKVRGKYATNAAGEKDGAFTEYYENGKVRAKGTYRGGKLHGPYKAHYPSGTLLSSGTYDDGVLTGKYTEHTPQGNPRLTAVYKDGRPTNLKLTAGTAVVADQEFRDKWVPPRRLAEIQADLANIATAPAAKAGDAITAEREAALRRLMGYRAAVGVAFEDLTLDPEMNAQSTAGAELCQVIGRMDHTPANTVKWADDRYQRAYKGTSSSNLYRSSGGTPLAGSVDGYLDDSDPRNIERVGHRRWCLNPAMLKLGFGRSPSGEYSAMWAQDQSREAVPDYDYVALPPTGFAPIGYFGPRHAWSFSPNRAKFRIADPNAVTVKLYHKTDRSPDKPGSEVKLDYSRTDTGNFGSGPCVIFRPQSVDLVEGSRYVVEIAGLSDTGGQPVTVSYLVIFVTTV